MHRGQVQEQRWQRRVSACPLGSATLFAGAAEQNACLTVPGYYGNMSAGISECANGSYTTSPGMSVCDRCPPGATSVMRATSVAQCVCQHPAWRPNAVSLCVCSPSLARGTIIPTCASCVLQTFRALETIRQHSSARAHLSRHQAAQHRQTASAHLATLAQQEARVAHAEQDNGRLPTGVLRAANVLPTQAALKAS